MGKTKYFLLLISFVAAGCKVGPDYQRPCVPIPEQWVHEAEGRHEWVNAPWWEQFNDPVLVDLIATAVSGNKDLSLAAARVQEFAGLYKAVYGDLFPFLGGEGTGGRELKSEAVTPTPVGMNNPENFFRLVLSGSWELDLWGKLRRATEAARADLLASEQARRSVVQTLVSAVAVSYINLLQLDRQLEISLRTAETRKETLELFRKRHRAGVISRVELSQIESEYEDALARIPEFKRLIGEQENAISVLLGKNPGKIPRGGRIDQLTLPQIPGSLPSQLLCQRPDIREAEQVLIAANARIGVARAQYFPEIFLTGEYGTASLDTKDLFKGKSNTWNYFVPVSVPIFTAGRISGEVEAAEAVKGQALAAYERSIIDAFREVENSLISIAQTREQLEAEERQVGSLQEYSDLARLRYDEGYTSYLEVLDAERSLFSVELEYTQTYGNFFFSFVNLYKSLGGGWIDEADSLKSRQNSSPGVM